MKEELAKAYNASEVEEKIYKMWEEGGYFSPKGEGKPFVMVIPPPNVTGSLHMGHALNGTIQDILIRWHRMMGEPTLWIPGTDHAGIATQNVVEKKLAKEGPSRQGGAEAGKSRFDWGREKFVEEVWKWREEYGHLIVDQLKKLGASCDWNYERFTMDEGYSEAVQKAFIHYYEKGWIYQGERVINWCPRCRTALSDIEVTYKEQINKLWMIKYPLKNPNDKFPRLRRGFGGQAISNEIQNSKTQIPNHIIVATTRPETMLGDTAVAVNPADERFKKLIGRKVKLPLTGREIPIIADEAVDAKFGTGAVKVTPAHDATDFEIAERHNLPKIKAIDEEGKMTYEAGEEFKGLDRFKARKLVLEKLEEQELLVKIKDYKNSVPFCARCDTIIEPLLSKQWFVKMEELAKPAIEVVKEDRIKFVPKQWKKVYLDWLENIRDWCISRQIWWGHRLPVWTREVDLKSQISNLKSNENDFYVGDNPPEGYRQVDDVLDTWFSSALWPIAVFLTKNRSSEKRKVKSEKLKKVSEIFGEDLTTEDLEHFYPTSVLTTDRGILYLWVARMVFSGMEFMGEIPFSTVYIHPTVFNVEGKRMSKSLGTGVDPLELMDIYGTDATRFGLMLQNTGGQDIKFSEESILAGKKFCNKIWNAARFIMMNMEMSNVKFPMSKPHLKSKILTDADKKILESLEEIIKSTDENLEKFRFGQIIEDLYHFFWNDFCDLYIEESKKQIQDEKLKTNTQAVLAEVLLTSLKLLHPFIPFVTEEIYGKITGEPLIVSKWPEESKK